MVNDDFYRAEFIRSVIKRKYDVPISILDIWSEYRLGNVRSRIINGEVYFDLSELMIIFNPKKLERRPLKERIRESVIERYDEWWGKPLNGSYDDEADWKITPADLIKYNSNRVKSKPLYLKEKKDE